MCRERLKLILKALAVTRSGKNSLQVQSRPFWTFTVKEAVVTVTLHAKIGLHDGKLKTKMTLALVLWRSAVSADSLDNSHNLRTVAVAP